MFNMDGKSLLCDILNHINRVSFYRWILNRKDEKDDLQMAWSIYGIEQDGYTIYK